MGKVAESKAEEEGAGISLRELMSGRRNSETAANTVMAVTSGIPPIPPPPPTKPFPMLTQHTRTHTTPAPDRKVREETGEARASGPVPRSAQLSKPQTASKVSKRWAKKLTQVRAWLSLGWLAQRD